jgi:hypothetical protein
MAKLTEEYLREVIATFQPDSKKTLTLDDAEEIVNNFYKILAETEIDARNKNKQVQAEKSIIPAIVNTSPFRRRREKQEKAGE